MGDAPIRVDAAGLTALAAHCQDQAAALGVADAAPVDGQGGQPSLVAVRGAHGVLAATQARLAARLTETGALAHAAAAKYAGTDQTSAAALSAVPAGLTEV